MKHPKCSWLGPYPGSADAKTECRECAKKAARISEIEAQVAAMVEAKRAAKREAMRAYRKRKKENG